MFCSNCGNNLNQDGTCSYCSTVKTIPNNNSMDKKQKNILIGMASLVVALFLVLVVQSILGVSVLDTEDNGPKTRTIMIYMVGSNLESDSGIATSDLDSIDPALVDLDNVKVLLYTGGTKRWHNFVSNEENAIYELKSDGFEKVKTYEKLNMGDSETLSEFINYSYDNYKTKKYDLIFYNHGGAIDGAIYDDFSNDNLSLSEFREALSNTPFKKNKKLETVLFRTCLNGTLEVASIFAPFADYLVASEEVTNGAKGTSVLDFLNNISIDDSTVDYGKKYITSYDNQMQNIFVPLDHPMMYSIIDLSKIEKLNKELNSFISSIDLNKNYSNIVKLRAGLFQFGYSYYNDGTYDMVDLYSLVEGLQKYAGSDATKLLNLINETVVYNWSSSDEFHGLSIYFPYRGSKQIQNKWLDSYSNYNMPSNYNKFINDFSSYSTSKKSSSFANFSNKNSVKIENKNEFSLELTDQQREDYADSIYILFNKQDNGMYKVAYSSDNATLDGNVLRTNISNNLIKVVDTSTSEDAYLMIAERMKDGKKSVTTGAVLTDVENTDPFKITATTAFFEFKEDGTPYVSSYIQLENGKASGSVVDTSEYQYVSLLASDYKILDENGNYTEEWDNEGVIKGVELKLKDVAFKRATLDDNGEYYCIFKIQDIYGNVYYSDLMHLN